MVRLRRWLCHLLNSPDNDDDGRNNNIKLVMDERHRRRRNRMDGSAKCQSQSFSRLAKRALKKKPQLTRKTRRGWCSGWPFMLKRQVVVASTPCTRLALSYQLVIRRVHRSRTWCSISQSGGFGVWSITFCSRPLLDEHWTEVVWTEVAKSFEYKWGKLDASESKFPGKSNVPDSRKAGCDIKCIVLGFYGFLLPIGAQCRCWWASINLKQSWRLRWVGWECISLSLPWDMK